MLNNEINQSLELDIQFALPSSAPLPNPEDIETWVTVVLETQRHSGETHLTIRMVDEPEGVELNEEYRGKKGATNVLSFPYEGFDKLDIPLLGDIVICNPVIIREARQQDKKYKAHLCHMVVHGVLHLLGYDHIKEQDALVMEDCEIKILGGLGFSNPYK